MKPLLFLLLFPFRLLFAIILGGLMYSSFAEITDPYEREFIKDDIKKLFKFVFYGCFLLFPLFGWGQTFEPKASGWIDVWPEHTVTDAVNRPFKYCYIQIGGVCYQKADTIPVTIEVQYLKRDLPGLRDCYLINGEPWYKTNALIARNRWRKIYCYRWKISEGWINQ